MEVLLTMLKPVAKVVVIILLFILLFCIIKLAIDEIEDERCSNMPIDQMINDDRCQNYWRDKQ